MFARREKRNSLTSKDYESGMTREPMQQQLDLIEGHSLRDVPSFRDDREMMSNPFWALTRVAPNDVLERNWQDDEGNGLHIRVSPNEYGRPTVYDRRVLQYALTLLTDRLNRGEPVSRTIRFAAHDYIVSTGRLPGGTEYRLFQDSLKRLKGATIYTNLGAGSKVHEGGFGWIDSYMVHKQKQANGKLAMTSVEITLCDWAYNAIVVERRFLKLDREYFSLTSGLDMMVYTIISRHIGNKNSWNISLDKLHVKTGSSSSFKSFVYDIRKMIERDPFSAWSLNLTTDGRFPHMGGTITPPVKGKRGPVYLHVFRKGTMRSITPR